MNDADHSFFGGSTAELAVSQIHAIHQRAFRAMTGDAVVAEQLSAIFDIRWTVSVLGGERDHSRQRE